MGKELMKKKCIPLVVNSVYILKCSGTNMQHTSGKTKTGNHGPC